MTDDLDAMMVRQALSRLAATAAISQPEFVMLSQHHPSATTPPPRSVLVLDSSFNPPTRAHLALLEAAESALHPDATLLLLAIRNADKGQVNAQDVERRVAMMRALGGDGQRLIGLTNASRFVDKSDALVCHPPWASPSPPHFHFIMGADTVQRFFDPKYYPPGLQVSEVLAPFFQRAAIVAAERGVTSKTTAHPIHWLSPLPADIAAISSTTARQALLDGDGEKARQLLPPTVFDLIMRNRWYQR